MLVFLAVGCSKIENRYILENIKHTEFQKMTLLKEEPLFGEFVTYVDDNTKKFSKKDSAYFSDITYKDLYYFSKKVSTLHTPQLHLQWEDDYEEYKAPYYDKFEKIVDSYEGEYKKDRFSKNIPIGVYLVFEGNLSKDGYNYYVKKMINDSTFMTSNEYITSRRENLFKQLGGKKGEFLHKYGVYLIK